MSRTQSLGAATAPSPTRPLNVLHVIDGLGHGGAETVMLNELRLIDPARFRMFVVSISDNYHPKVLDRARANSDAATIISGRRLWDPRLTAAVVRVIAREHIDVVHTHLEGADVIGGAAAQLARRPVVSTLHIVHEWRENLKPARRRLADFATRRFARRFIAVSEGVKESHVRRLGVDPAAIDVLPNVSLADRSLPADFDAATTRAALGVPDGTVLCTVANLIENKKDVPTLIRALPLVREHVGDAFSLLVVGDGPQRSQLSDLAAALGVARHVRFLGFRDDALEIMAASDVLCHATLFEGMPMVVLEAMALGIPVVATRARGVTELIEDGRSGLLCEPQDPRALADAIARLISSPSLRSELGRGAQHEIETKFDPDVWIATIERIYSALAT